MLPTRHAPPVHMRVPVQGSCPHTPMGPFPSPRGKLIFFGVGVAGEGMGLGALRDRPPGVGEGTGTAAPALSSGAFSEAELRPSGEGSAVRPQ